MVHAIIHAIVIVNNRRCERTIKKGDILSRMCVIITWSVGENTFKHIHVYYIIHMCRKHHFFVKVNIGKGVNTQTFCRNHEARLTVFPCTNTKPIPFQLSTLRWPLMSKQIRNALGYNTNESYTCLHCSVLVALRSYKFKSHF